MQAQPPELAAVSGAIPVVGGVGERIIQAGGSTAVDGLRRARALTPGCSPRASDHQPIPGFGARTGRSSLDLVGRAVAGACQTPRGWSVTGTVAQDGLARERRTVENCPEIRRGFILTGARARPWDVVAKSRAWIFGVLIVCGARQASGSRRWALVKLTKLAGVRGFGDRQVCWRARGSQSSAFARVGFFTTTRPDSAAPALEHDGRPLRRRRGVRAGPAAREPRASGVLARAKRLPSSAIARPGTGRNLSGRAIRQVRRRIARPGATGRRRPPLIRRRCAATSR
jgi:hypothetical protein